MSTVDEATALAGRPRRLNGGRVARRHGWTIGVYVLLVGLIIAVVRSARTVRSGTSPVS